MDRAQEKLNILLGEVRDICKEHDLPVFLLFDSAKAACHLGHFAPAQITVRVGMLWRDVVAFQTIVEKEKPAGRKIESLYTNGEFRSTVFRYVDTSSTYINKALHYNAKELGLAVDILPLMSVDCEVPGRKMKRMNAVQSFLYRKTGREEADRERTRMVIACVQKMRRGESLTSPERIKMLNTISRMQKNASFEDVLYYRYVSNLKRKYFVKGLFSKTSEVVLEGKTYLIPKRFETLSPPAERRGDWYEILDEDMPYEKYLGYLKDQGLEQYIEKKMAFKVLGKQKKRNDYIEDSWDIVLRTVARINLWEQYMPLKPKIMELRAQEDWEALGQILTDYDDAMNRLRRKKMIVYFDEDIFKTYCEWIEHTGRPNPEERWRKLIPEEHFKPVVIDGYENVNN